MCVCVCVCVCVSEGRLKYDDVISDFDDLFDNGIQVLQHRCTECVDQKKELVEK